MHTCTSVAGAWPQEASDITIILVILTGLIVLLAVWSKFVLVEAVTKTAVIHFQVQTLLPRIMAEHAPFFHTPPRVKMAGWGDHSCKVFASW